jgi:hypothetical protein
VGDMHRHQLRRLALAQVIRPCAEELLTRCAGGPARPKTPDRLPQIARPRSRCFTTSSCDSLQST